MALTLGIETSCDETAASVVEDGRQVLSNVVSSQMAKHAPYGGVVPELAAREHLSAIPHVVGEALSSAKIGLHDLDAIAVTNGPGLVPALLVGLNFAKGLSIANGIPIIGVNHFLAHIYGVFVDSPAREFENPSLYPMMALVVSGGHTSIVIISSDGKARIVGTTLDDAAGEAFDKAAKMLNLGYPGGPVIEKAATKGDFAKFKFPRSLTGSAGRPLDHSNRFNFSFSGLKTALLYHAKSYGGGEHLEGQELYDSLASYQEAIVDVLCAKAFDAAAYFGAVSVALCGGVACNTPLRRRFESLCPEGLACYIAPKKYCTDNAAMVAGLAYHYLITGHRDGIGMDAFARLPQITDVPFLWNRLHP